jgi:multisubunit Na+/H+ antiporter MnhE subunit
MHPDWLGNPQHFVAGFVVAAALIWAAPRISITNAWLAAVFAVGIVMIAEALVEMVEYPLMYSDDPNLSAYLDTLSDLANSLAGAVVGVAVATAFTRHRSSVK